MRLRLAAGAVLLSSCSWMLVPKTRPGEECERSRIAPALDRTHEVAAAVETAVFMAMALDGGYAGVRVDQGSSEDMAVAALVGAAMIVAFDRSAAYGFREVGRCRARSEPGLVLAAPDAGR